MDKKKEKQVFRVAGIYIAVILGAGFASGQEIISYFIRFGKPGFAGLFLSAALFGFVGYGVFAICISKKIDNYNDFIALIAGKKTGAALEVVLTAFMFILFATMLAAAGATMHEAFSVPYYKGVLIVAFMCFVSFLYGIKGIIQINTFLAPLMIFGSVFITFYIVIAESVPVFGVSASLLNIRENYIVSAVIYVCYNIITAITVLSALRNKVETKINAVKSGAMAGILIFILGASIGIPLYMNYDFVGSFEIPLLALVHKHSSIIEYFYLLIMAAAVFSTAATNGYAVVSWIEGRFHKTGISIKILICAFGIFLSFAGFSNFVGTVYPLFAAAGFLEVLLIIKFLWKRNKK